MTLIEAVVCGIIQGAAEFLPISSSGHLALLHAMFGLTDPESCVTFDVMLHLATLAAIVPGLSRSGTTITGGLICGLDRGQAVRFSFIMSVPAIIGANLVRAVRMVRSPVESSQLGVYAVGMVFAAVTGFFALKLLSYIAEKKKFGIFSIYCFAVGGAAVIFG